MKKSEIFKHIYANVAKRDKFVDSLPPYFQEVVYDNEYSSLLNEDNDILMNAVFGDHYEAIMWFIYEWTPGMQVYASKEAPGLAINDIDEYIDYLKKYEDFNDE